MNMNAQSHSHGGKSHLIGMLGIGAVVLVALLVAGRSAREALPLAAALACPLMMVGMMFMMRRGNNQQHTQHSNDESDHDTSAEQLGAAHPQRFDRG